MSAGEVPDRERSPDAAGIDVLLARVDAAWANLNQLVDGLSHDQMTAPGPEGWSIKDHLAHITGWERILLASLEGQPPHARLRLEPGQYDVRDIDGVNAFLYERERSRSLDDVRAAFQETHREVRSALSRLSDDDLQRPYADFQSDDPSFAQEPVARWIVANTSGHYEEHVPWIEAVVAAGKG
jgi:hypothetical protein